MNTEKYQDRKEQLAQLEIRLRLEGQKLDSLWTQARTAIGRVRVEVHNQIGPLRAKLQAGRKEQEALKKADAVISLESKPIADNLKFDLN